MKAFLLAALLAPLSAAAREGDDTVRLREALKSLNLQLRGAQSETANAQAASIAAEQRAAELGTKLAGLEKRYAELAREFNDYKADTDKKTAALNNRLAEREKRLADYIAALDKWKAAHQAAIAVVRKAEAELAGRREELASLKNTVADRERKNLALFRISGEILDRYENYALGKALSAKEPFIGTTRVEIENQVEGYRDRILDQRLAAPPKP